MGSRLVSVVLCCAFGTAGYLGRSAQEPRATEEARLVLQRGLDDAGLEEWALSREKLGLKVSVWGPGITGRPGLGVNDAVIINIEGTTWQFLHFPDLGWKLTLAGVSEDQREGFLRNLRVPAHLQEDEVLRHGRLPVLYDNNLDGLWDIVYLGRPMGDRMKFGVLTVVGPEEQEGQEEQEDQEEQDEPQERQA